MWLFCFSILKPLTWLAQQKSLPKNLDFALGDTEGWLHIASVMSMTGNDVNISQKPRFGMTQQ